MRPTLRLWTRLHRRPLAMVMLAILMGYLTVAMLVEGGVLATSWTKRVGPGWEAPSWEHPLGTDRLGRSVLSKTLCATRTSLLVSLSAGALAVGIGTLLGLMAGYFRGVVDEGIVWLYTTLSAVPGLLLMLAFAFVLQDVRIFGWSLRGVPAMSLALGLGGWVGMCRLVRGEVIKCQESDYVSAARVLGVSAWGILRRHLLPAVGHLVILEYSLTTIHFVGAEVVLSFLGLGPTQVPSWGGMIDEARLELSSQVWWQMAAASAAVFVLSLALHVFGDALHEARGPRAQRWS